MADGEPGQQIVIRAAHAGDTMALAELAVLAGHGLFEIFYGGLVPGLSTLETVVRHRIEWPGGFSETKRWRVAEDATGTTLGALNSFPHEVFESANPDPLVAGRVAAVDALTELEAEAAGTYYVNMIAVFPERRSGGVGRLLMDEAERLARQQGFAQMALCTFEADSRLVEFYERQGYRITKTKPIAPHPHLEHSGSWALLTKTLHP